MADKEVPNKVMEKNKYLPTRIVIEELYKARHLYSLDAAVVVKRGEGNLAVVFEERSIQVIVV